MLCPWSWRLPSSFSSFSLFIKNPTHHSRPTLSSLYPSLNALRDNHSNFPWWWVELPLALRMETHCSGHRLKESNPRHWAIRLFHHLYLQAMNAVNPEGVCQWILQKDCVNRFRVLCPDWDVSHLFKWSSKLLVIPISGMMLRVNLDPKKHWAAKTLKRPHEGRAGLMVTWDSWGSCWHYTTPVSYVPFRVKCCEVCLLCILFLHISLSLFGTTL